MKLAIVGATGMVGTVMLEVLKERNFKYDQLLLVASKKSVGKTISYLGKHYSLIDLEMALEEWGAPVTTVKISQIEKEYGPVDIIFDPTGFKKENPIQITRLSMNR